MAINRLTNATLNKSDSIDSTIELPIQQNNYLDEISNIKTELTLLNSMIEEIKNIQALSLEAVTKDKVELYSRQLEEKNLASKSQIQFIKQKIENLKQLPKDITTPSKIRSSQFNTVKTDLLDNIKRYQKIEKNYRHSTKLVISSKYKLIHPEATQAEIEEVINNGLTGSVFADHILTATRVNDANKTLKEVEKRSQDVKKLLKSIEELAQLYQEMEYLIEDQGKHIDAVAIDIEKTDNNLKNANQNLTKATESAVSAQKKKWILAAIALIILIIIIVVIVVLIK